MTTDEFKLAFSERLRTLRMSRGLTQPQLGTMIGLSSKTAARTIAKWENCERSPGSEYMRPLADALSCTLDELIP